MTLACVMAGMSVFAQVKVAPAEYVEEGEMLELKSKQGKVMIAFDIELGKKFINQNQLCVITPMFVNGSFQDEFPAVILEGKKYAVLAREAEEFDGKVYPNYADKIVYCGESKVMHYQVTAPYNPEYKGATLVLNYKVYDICGKEVAEQSTCLAHGVTDYADFIEDNPVVYYYPNTVRKAYVNDFSNRSIFRQGRTAIDMPVFRTNGYDDMVAEVERLSADADTHISEVNVLTSASPEGPLKNNKRLAEKRSEVMTKQFTKDLKLDAGIITREWIDENWDAFMEELPASGLDNVSDIRRIIAETEDLDKREAALKKLPNYKEIYAIFQDLRNCLVTIDYATREYFETEAMIDGKAFAAVTLGKEEPAISLQSTRKYFEGNSNDVTANNMMVALMDAGEYEAALEYAEMIPNRGIDPVIANNKGVLYMYLDDMYMSSTMFDLAKCVPMSDYNEGLMLLKNEEYEQAAELLNGYDYSVNSVVANIYAGDYDAAARSTHLNEQSAETHYLRAIAYAKKNHEKLALGALERAIAGDESYKQTALNQAEFIPYRTNEKFIEITR